METTPLEGILGFSETCKALGLEHSCQQTTYSLETPRVVPIVASLLERSIRRNERVLRATAILTKEYDIVTIFHGSRAPELGVKEYMERIFKYSNCSASCFIVAYIYVEKFIQRRSGFCLTSLSIHRLLITCIMVAAKFLDDKCENNAYYAAVGGVSTKEMNELELELLFSLEFRLQVTTEVFARYCQYLKREGDGSGEYQADSRSSIGRRGIISRLIAEYESHGCRTM